MMLVFLIASRSLPKGLILLIASAQIGGFVTLSRGATGGGNEGNVSLTVVVDVVDFGAGGRVTP